MQSLIDRCQAREIPVVQVFHRELPDDAANPFAAASGHGTGDAASCHCSPAVMVYKQVHSAMFGRAADGTTLEEWLRQRGISELLITGIRTEQCCETTTRHASDLGLAVRYVTDATLTFAMRTRAGREGPRRRSASAPSWCWTAASRRWSRPQPRSTEATRRASVPRATAGRVACYGPLSLATRNLTSSMS